MVDGGSTLNARRCVSGTERYTLSGTTRMQSANKVVQLPAPDSHRKSIDEKNGEPRDEGEQKTRYASETVVR